MEAWLARRLQLDPGEARRAFALGTILYGLIASYTLVKTVRDAFFLAELPASLLPWVFLGVGGLTAIASVLLARLTHRRAMWESLSVSSLGVALSLLLFAQLFRVGAGWVPVAFYLWVNVYGLILIAQFWAFANSISHAREAKRTFSIVGVGGILGGLTGGLVAAPLAHAWSLATLLAVGAVVQLVVAALIWRASRADSIVGSEVAPPDEETTTKPLGNTYVRWLAIATLCSVMVTALLDYQFKVQLQQRFPSSPASLASFLGLYYTAINLAALTVQLFATRWLIQRFGATSSASLLPGGLAAGVAATLLFPGFLAVSLTRLWDQVLRLSLSKSAGELFYFPIEPGLRRRAKALIEAGIERLGDGFAGIVILLAAATMGTGTRTLAAIVALLLATWVFAWLRVRTGYVSELGRNLKRLNLDHHHVRISLREAGLLREMAGLLDSRYERIVLHGIEMLSENAGDEIEQYFDRLLSHPSPRVRARALQLVGLRRFEAARARVAQLIMDGDPEVRVQALIAHGALQGGDPVGPMEEFLTSDDAGLRAAAIHGIVSQVDAGSEVRVHNLLQGLLRSGSVGDRAAVALALGDRPAPSLLHDLLGPLLADAEIEVRRAALSSAGAAQRRPHVPILIDALGRRDTEDAARAGLVSLGDRVVGTLADYLTDASVPIEIRLAIPRVLADVPTQESLNALFRSRDRSEVRVAYRVLKAANKLRASGVPLRFPRPLITEDIGHDAKAYLFSFVHYRACPLGEGKSAERLLCISLNERMEQSLNRLFRRLALLYPAQEMLAAYTGVVSDDPRLRGNALEYLENALAAEHAALVLPLVDDIGDEGRLVAAQRQGLRIGTFEQTLEAILMNDDAWLRACALYVVGSRREARMLPLVESNLNTLDRLVAETATWARLAIAG